MKIDVFESTAVNPGDFFWNGITQLGDVTIKDCTALKDAAACIGDTEIVLMNKTPITAEVLDACPYLRLICIQATGYKGAQTMWGMMMQFGAVRSGESEGIGSA